jgi:hypothetical protein
MVTTISARVGVRGDAYSDRKAVDYGVSRTRVFAMLVTAVLWTVTPAVACLLPMRLMTQVEHECCRRMAQQCR